MNLDSPKCAVAQNFLQLQAKKSQFLLAQQNIFEVLRVITHKKYTTAFTTAEAVLALKPILEVATVIYPTYETLDIAQALIEKYSISGSEVFDAYLVATAIGNGCYEIATDNEKHLSKYNEISVMNPFK